MLKHVTQHLQINAKGCVCFAFQIYVSWSYTQVRLIAHPLVKESRLVKIMRLQPDRCGVVPLKALREVSLWLLRWQANILASEVTVTK